MRITNVMNSKLWDDFCLTKISMKVNFFFTFRSISSEQQTKDDLSPFLQDYCRGEPKKIIKYFVHVKVFLYKGPMLRRKNRFKNGKNILRGVTPT